MFDWQNSVALLIVAVAASYLVRSVWVRLSGQAGGCGSCPSGKQGCASEQTANDSSAAPNDVVSTESLLESVESLRQSVAQPPDSTSPRPAPPHE